MKKLLSLLLVMIATNVVSAHEMTKEELIMALKENHHRAAAGHNPYESSECKDTRAPRGYKPVYVSHYSRHGSRYQGSCHSFEKVLPVMDTLAKHGLLTPDGDSLRFELHLMCEAHDDKASLLTGNGRREQAQVAGRLFHRVPRLFCQKNSRKVSCVSTSAQRCLQSMAEFGTALKGVASTLEIVYDTGGDKLLHYLAPRVQKAERESIGSHYLPLQDSLLNVSSAPASAAVRFFTDPRAAELYHKGSEFIYELFEAAQGAGCLDVAVDPLRFFSAEELYEFMEIRNLYFCANYGPLAPTKAVREQAAVPLARGIVLQADAALAGNGYCADFRFGHDGGMGPLFMLIGVEGFDKPVDPQNALAQWQAWRYIPMCSNLQMIFYRNRKGNVLVKFLRNENEVLVPGLTPVETVYYSWQDVRRHILKRTGDYKDLPEYYEKYLDKKADEIAALKRYEADGFFFWTDTHYPDNAGNTAAILEYVQNKIGVCKLFSGGDAALNADRLKEGVDANSASWLQLCANGLFFPVRGNHDFTSSTSWKVLYPETMGNIQVHDYLSWFTSPEAVTCTCGYPSNYYYVDSSKARIRYIVLDSTDSIKDDRVKYGMSEHQQRWFAMVTSTLPEGWSVLILSHVPFAKDHTTLPSLVAVGDAISSLSHERNVLLALCGHRHSDVESGISDVFQVLTAADCLVDMGKIQTPYSVKQPKKAAGTVSEQTIDYVSISKDHSKVIMKRIGYGNDRIFNVKPVKGKVGSVVRLKSEIEGNVDWFAYDAEGSKVIPSGDGWNRIFETSHRNASVTSDGLVTVLSSAPSIVVATGSCGTKEYFMIDGR